MKHFSTYVICHLQGPCAPTPQLKPNIYHPLVKILFLKEVFKLLFFLVSLPHSFCLQLPSSLHVYFQSKLWQLICWRGWKTNCYSVQSKTQTSLAHLFCVSFNTVEKASTHAIFPLLRKQNIDSIEKTLWWGLKEALSKCKSKQNKKAKGVKTDFSQPKHWSNFIVSCVWLYYIHFVCWGLCLEMLLLSSPHTHFPKQESFWDLADGYKQ